MFVFVMAIEEDSKIDWIITFVITSVSVGV